MVYNTIHHNTHPASQNFGDNFVKSGAARDGPIVLDGFHNITFGDEGNHGSVESNIHPIIIK